ncbi:YajG family lipoprotein [Thalassotalea piscium]
MIKPHILLRSSLIALFLLLSACTSNIKHLVIAPEILTSSNPQISTQAISITTSDLRSASHILQIVKEDKAAELITSQGSLAEIIDSALRSAYQKSGVQVSPSANNVINVAINKALINVNQSMLKYTANTAIELSVRTNNGEKTLTKTYRSSGTSNGPLKADIAVLERDFNQQLSKLIVNIINDPQLIAFMR